MFKLGVHSIQQLKKGEIRTAFGAAKKVSATLLDKIDDLEASADAFASIMFFLNDDRGAFKRTYSSRFGEFNDKCIDTIQRNFETPALTFHDVAVSSAETSVELFEQLRLKYDELCYIASDYDPYLTVLGHDSLSVVIASSGSILEITLPPFVFTPKPPDRWFYPINRLIHHVANKYWAKPLVAEYKAGTLAPDSVRKIELFCPQARQLANQDSRFQLRRHDLLSAIDDTFQCIRAMNVLNESYFSPDQLQEVLLNIHRSLDENGLFIVGSNQNPGSPVSGGVFRRNESVFERVWVTTAIPNIAKHISLFNDQSDRIPSHSDNGRSSYSKAGLPKESLSRSSVVKD